MIITESWLQPLIPDTATQLAGRICYRLDRDKESGKSRGGGLCVYLHNDWCCNSKITARHCCPDLEALSVMCRPFYLPQELSAVTVTAVYIPPDANVSIALNHLLTIVNKLQQDYPEGAHIIAGDFNQACLKYVLPHFYQHVNCATRGSNTLDRVYSNIKHAYKAVALSHLGLSDHLSLSLTPAYTPLIRTTKPCTKIIKTWPEGALTQLQDCFANTCWDLFYQEDLENFTETVLFYIKCCMDNVTVDKYIRIFPNQKPWMTSKVHCLLKKRNIAFRSGNEAQYSTARADLRRGIKEAKDDYRRKIEGYLEQDNSRSMWQAIQNITKYKRSTNSDPNGDASLCEQLNCFFARFEANMAVLSSFPPHLTLVPTYSRCRNMT